MKTSKEELEYIKFALGHAATRKTAFDDTQCKTVKPGNVYLPAERGDVPAYWLLVTEKNEDVYNIVPLFHWVENTGPMDIILSEDIFGELMTVSFELECSLPESSLGKSAGKLTVKVMKDILSARASLDSGTIKGRAKGFNWGWEYIDENELRYRFHADLLQELIALQQPLRESIFNQESVSSAGTFAGQMVIAWPEIKQELEALPMAAADEEEIQIPVVSFDSRTVLASAEPKLKCWALPDSFPPMPSGSLCYVANAENGVILGNAELINRRIVPADKKLLAEKNICIVIEQKTGKN